MTLRVECALESDEDTVIELILATMDTYRHWCPGWCLPADAESFERARWREDDCSRSWLVARLDEHLVGVARWGAGEPASLSLLMVDPVCWGTAVADALHRRALEQMARDGSENARLTAPIANLRARRFYERHGWRTANAEHHLHPWLNLRMVKYTCVL